MKEFDRPEKNIPRIDGDLSNHEKDWMRAGKEGKVVPWQVRTSIIPTL